MCGRPGTLIVFEAVQDTPALPEGFAARLIVAALAGLLVSAGVAFALARRMSRPLGELARSARSLATGEVRSVGASSPGDPAEIADLKDAFDGMVNDLRAAREREESFLLSVSHELRTPLTAIRGYGEALADGTTQRPRQAGAVIARESQRLERLVQDLLDLARLQTGEFSVHPHSVDITDVAHSVAEALRPAADDGGVRIEVDADGAVMAHTDSDRVHQMIANLVENAIRVTPQGGTVAVEAKDGVIAVVDSGPGIEQPDLAHAFERFYLWSRYKGERPVGSGLGLAIVGELARRLDMTVTVRSTPGEGSRFELRFDA